jgi:hypothetical protein
MRAAHFSHKMPEQPELCCGDFKMARRVYFAFHYQKDITRVNVVRNSPLLQEQAGFYDGSLWEKAKRTSDDALKRLIDDGMSGTSVTAFLLGQETARRPWVRYELENSFNRGNGLLAVYIHGIKDFSGNYGVIGENIFDTFNFPNSHVRAGQRLSTFYQAYDWIAGNGYANFGSWVEAAAKAVGK